MRSGILDCQFKATRNISRKLAKYGYIIQFCGCRGGHVRQMWFLTKKLLQIIPWKWKSGTEVFVYKEIDKLPSDRAS